MSYKKDIAPQGLTAATAVRDLVLSCNALHGLEGLGEMPALTQLDVAYNRLSSLTSLAVLPDVYNKHE